METNLTEEKVKLTKYSHGAGCGCKISPEILDEILKTNYDLSQYKNLMVGNDSRDDAAVFKINEQLALISTTDFFMPIVDDPYDFGRIAATNAISDVYAMGGTPTMAIAILGWPVNVLKPAIASVVLEGAQHVCNEARIPLAGGHSIDSPEPIFGLSVNGLINPVNLKANNTAEIGDLIFLTKKLGIGIYTTAQKKGLINNSDMNEAISSMTTLNSIGEKLAKLDGVTSMTDVTGFGLLGHLCEMVSGENFTAEISHKTIPVFSNIENYISKNCIPGGTKRNLKSFGHKIHNTVAGSEHIYADPQTSGGLIFTLKPAYYGELKGLMSELNMPEYSANPIGKIISRTKHSVHIL